LKARLKPAEWYFEWRSPSTKVDGKRKTARQKSADVNFEWRLPPTEVGGKRKLPGAKPDWNPPILSWTPRESRMQNPFAFTAAESDYS